MDTAFDRPKRRPIKQLLNYRPLHQQPQYRRPLSTYLLQVVLFPLSHTKTSTQMSLILMMGENATCTSISLARHTQFWPTLVLRLHAWDCVFCRQTPNFDRGNCLCVQQMDQS
jgi:hypothetical protein